MSPHEKPRQRSPGGVCLLFNSEEATGVSLYPEP